MTTASVGRPDVAASLVEKIPLIVDLDAHVVEPPDVWSSRLPAKYRDVGPRIEYPPAGTPILDGGGYIEAPGTEGKPIAWWFYEDHHYSVKRLIAAAGYPPDEITLDGVTFDEMRPGCWQPAGARSPTWTSTASRPRSASRTTRASAARSSCARKDKELALLCVRGLQRLDGRGVVRRRAAVGSSRCASSRCGTPSSRPPRSGATRHAACARSRSASCPPYLGLPSIHSGYWDPFFDGLRRDRHGGLHAHRLGHQDAAARPPTRPMPSPAPSSSATASARMIDFLFSGVLAPLPRTSSCCTPSARSAGSRTSLERADDVWETHRGLERQPAAHCPEPPSTYYYRQVAQLLLQGPGRRRAARPGRRRQRHRSRPTTRTRTARGRTRARRPPSSSGTSTRRVVHKIARGNAIRLLDLDLEP